MPRKHLPNRRQCNTFIMRWYGTELTVSIGMFDDRTVAEVFVTGSKSGTDVQVLTRDGAILFSLARQHGVPLEVIAHALSRNPDGSPQGFLGALVDRIIEETE